MRLYDISRPLLGAPVYPGDPAPVLSRLCGFEAGQDYQLSSLSLCCHNATHLDAPLHVSPNGEAVDALDLRRCMGVCRVASTQGDVTAAQVECLALPAGRAVLWKGAAGLTQGAAQALVRAGVSLVGIDALSIAQGEHELPVHRILLGAGIPLLEGLDLRAVAPGEYVLLALPLRIEGAEASPVRAVLLAEERKGELDGFWTGLL